ncbi:MAG: anthranilate synthase component I [Chloroflexi bacterium]|nr:anthranilate synthase component I [Chloroflexota bacterium]
MADLETPVSAFLKTSRGDYSFLLESVEGGERLARYSFIGTEPYLVLKTGSPEVGTVGDGDPLPLVAEELGKYRVARSPDLPPFHGGAVGYMAYEVAGHFEALPSPELDPLALPQAVFMFTDTLLVFDHLKHKIKVVSHVPLDGNTRQSYLQAVEKIEDLVQRLAQPLPTRLVHQKPSRQVTSNMTKAEYEAMVQRAKEYIYAGDIIQVVLSLRLALSTSAHPFDIYRALRTINPSPYMYYLTLKDCTIVGASPELLVRAEGGVVATHPIAGTRPRGADAATDLALEEELRGDEKEQAEHIMLVDLGRNDIGRVSQPGTVTVPQLMDVERYSHVMHLVSHVEGKLRSDMTPLDALRACFPAGTVSGAPKIRAMEIIAELEPDKRGPYAGAVGYLSFSGNLDTAITIRTIVIKDGVAYVQAGAGIVADSVPEREHQESLNKAQALLRAIQEAENRGW